MHSALIAWRMQLLPANWLYLLVLLFISDLASALGWQQSVWFCLGPPSQMFEASSTVSFCQPNALWLGWKMGLKVVNFERLFLHQFSTKIYQTLRDNVQGVSKKRYFSYLHLISVLEVRVYFFHVIWNQSFEPVSSCHLEHLHTEYWVPYNA